MVGIELIIGHVIGDYALQNDWMAKNKVRNDLSGYWACLSHCFVYAFAVTIFVMLGGWDSKYTFLDRYGDTSTYLAFVIAFLSHFPIDKFSLGKWWMKLFGQTLEGPFAPIVYVGVDNGLHLTIMWCAFRILQA